MSYQQIQSQRKKAGLCIACGKPFTQERSTVRCNDCYTKWEEQVKIRHIEKARRVQHQCQVCEKIVPHEATLCASCLKNKAIARAEMLYGIVPGEETNGRTLWKWKERI